MDEFALPGTGPLLHWRGVTHSLVRVRCRRKPFVKEEAHGGLSAGHVRKTIAIGIVAFSSVGGACAKDSYLSGVHSIKRVSITVRA